MPIHTAPQFLDAYEQYKRHEEPRDIVMFYHKNQWSRGQHGFMTMDKHEMKPQMVKWRRLIKQGKLVCRDYNKKTLKADDGREWHVLVVQDAVQESNDVDAMGMFVLSFMVSGCLYAFQDKNNRDKVFDYINKLKKD